MKLNTAPYPTLQRQHGLALISALLALIVIAVIGVALGSGGILFRKATVAQEEQTTSLTAAESLLVAVERSIVRSQVNEPDQLNPDKNDSMLYTSTRSKATSGCNGEGWWALESCWNDANLKIITMQSENSGLFADNAPLKEARFDLKTDMGLTQQPRVRIEVDRTNAGLRPLNSADNAGGLRLYQITVHSTGRGETTETFLRSIYGVMENNLN